MTKKIIIFFIFLLAPIYVLSATSSASSTPSFKLTLSPIFENEVLRPGSSTPGSLEIINQGSNTIFYSVYATPYGVASENYTPVFRVLPNRPNISAWFNLSTKGGVLLPGQLDTINYSINVPASSPAGGYYAAIFVQSRSTSSGQKSNNVFVSNRDGELFYLEVPGKIVKNGKVASWGASLVQSNKVSADLKLENNGSIHFLSSVKVTFKSLFGSDAYSLSTQKFVLPQTIRDISFNWPNPPSFGIYKVSGTAKTTKTEMLETRYILIVSDSVRVKAAIALGLVILIILLDASVGTIIRRVKSLWKRLAK